MSYCKSVFFRLLFSLTFEVYLKFKFAYKLHIANCTYECEVYGVVSERKPRFRYKLFYKFFRRKIYLLVRNGKGSSFISTKRI